MRTVTAAACLFVLTIASGAAQSTGQGTRVVWGVGLEQNFSCIYTPPSQNAQAVFFVGEPIRLKVVIVNDTLATVSFSAREQAPGRLVAIAAPVPDAAGTLILERAKTPTLDGRGLHLTARWDQGIDLQSGDRLEWSIGLARAGGITPGRYELNVVPDWPDTGSNNFAVGVAAVTFEVRAPKGFAGSIEMLRRRAMWQYVDDDYTSADETFDELLRRYPDSYIARVMKGNIALQRGQRDRAAAFYKTALSLLESGGDRLYLTERQPPAHLLDEERSNLRGMLRSAQSAR